MPGSATHPGVFLLRVAYAVASLLPVAAATGIVSAGADPLHPPNTLTLAVLATPVVAAAVSLARHARSARWSASLTVCSIWWAAAALFLSGRVEAPSDVIGPVLAGLLPVWSLRIRFRKRRPNAGALPCTSHASSPERTVNPTSRTPTSR